MTILGIIMLGWLGYCLYYLLAHKKLREAMDISFFVLKGAFVYSMNLLTVIFLASYYSEKAIQYFLYKNFSYYKILNDYNQTNGEFIIHLSVFLTLIGITLYWEYRVLHQVGKKLQFYYLDNTIVCNTLKVTVFMLALVFQLLILYPLFYTGLMGNFSNPPVLIR